MPHATFGYRVFLRQGEGPEAPVQVFDIETETRGLATRAAQHAMGPGWEPYAVQVRYECIGQCRNCRAILFQDDDAIRLKPSGVKCRDC